jgi:hypothetical protein
MYMHTHRLQQLVYEKEKRLRVIMKMHGLPDTAYWLVSYLWNYLVRVFHYFVCLSEYVSGCVRMRLMCVCVCGGGLLVCLCLCVGGGGLSVCESVHLYGHDYLPLLV